MKIVSKFQDFYDGCSYMCGDVFYERKLNFLELKDSHSPLMKMPEKYKNESKLIRDEFDKKYKSYREYFYSFVIIGDIITPFITCEPKVNQYEFIYKGDSLDSILNSHENSWNKEFLEKDISKFLNKDHSEFLLRVREISDVPVISISTYRDEWGVPDVKKMATTITFNPVLKSLQFGGVMEPHIAIQEIEMFINKIRIKEVEFNDKIKLSQAGFDDKSFKHKVI